MHQDHESERNKDEEYDEEVEDDRDIITGDNQYNYILNNDSDNESVIVSLQFFNRDREVMGATPREEKYHDCSILIDTDLCSP